MSLVQDLTALISATGDILVKVLNVVVAIVETGGATEENIVAVVVQLFTILENLLPTLEVTLTNGAVSMVGTITIGAILEALAEI